MIEDGLPSPGPHRLLMSITETPNSEQEPRPEAEGQPTSANPPASNLEQYAGSRSRWVDYDTHELLDMIGQLEDERRWSRLREGIWLALIVHVLLISAATWIPRYVLKAPRVIDPFDAINQRKDLTYLDMPPDALRHIQPKAKLKPLPEQSRQIDKKTLDEIKKQAPPAPPKPEPEPQPQPQQQQAITSPVPQQTPQKSQQAEAPRPAAVPARPSFALGSQADQMRDAMRGSRSGSTLGGGGHLGHGGLNMHPGAGTGGVQVLSDTQGVDFSAWLQRWHHETQRTWDPLIPDSVNPPINRSGMVAIRFKVLPNGRLMEGSLVLEGRSGDVALDRAAWGALTGSNYPPLPHDFHGPYLELRAYFLYNMEAR